MLISSSLNSNSSDNKAKSIKSMSEITFTTITAQLCKPVAELVDMCFPDMPSIDKYSEEDLLKMNQTFPEGTIIALDGEMPVGMGTGIFTDLDFDNLPPTEHHLLEVNDESAHDPDGDYYYGSDFCVHPNYRKQGIGREIYNHRKAVVIRHKKVGFAAAAVLPGYENFKQNTDIHEYLGMVKRGDVFDSTLSMQMRNGFTVIKPIKDFYTYPRSDNWSALILWRPDKN
ncbi:MAG: GNAT family N-acetyltransferase [Chloroflexota bacterium]